MDRLSVPGALSLLAFLVGFGLVGLAAWVLATVSAAPTTGDDFGAGFAVVGALAAGTLGVTVVGFALTIAPADEDGGGVLTVGRRQRQLSGAGLAVLVASLLVPVAVVYVASLVTALTVWAGTVLLGTTLVVVAFVWTGSEALLTRFDVVG